MNEKQIDRETGEIVQPNQAALFAKLARVMAGLERLPKRGHNQHFNYAFVQDADVLDAVRSALAAEGIAFMASIGEIEQVVIGQDKQGRDRFKTRAQFVYTFADGETGATWSATWFGEAIDDQDKGVAKAATSALKYFLLKNFILSTGDPADDTDGAGETRGKAQRAAKVQSIQTTSPTNGNQQPIQPEPTKAEIEATQRLFYERVIRDIPFYHNAQAIGTVLKATGFIAYSQAKEAEMLAALQKHANEKANKEAA